MVGSARMTCISGLWGGESGGDDSELCVHFLILQQD